MEEIKTLNFFGENGLTSTSANHVANLAKESVRNVHEKLASVRFYTETIGLLTSDKEAVVSKGMSVDAVENLPKLVDEVTYANSINAFFREAMKEKERRMNEAQDYIDENAFADLRKKYSAHFLASPTKEPYPTEESIMQTWSIGEQEKYLSLGAEAAALGKFIHEDGSLSKARIDLMNKLENPTRVEINGSETVIHTYTPTVDIVTVDKVFNELQTRYRSVQAELNGMKKRIQDTIASEKLRIDTEYNEARREYDRVQREFEREEAELHRVMDIRRQQRVKKVQELKIAIPNRLRGIYDALTK